MHKRNVLNSPRLLEFKKKKRRVLLTKILLSIFTLLAVFAGLAYISRLPIFNIREVKITGNKVIDKDMIKTSVEKEIVGNYLWFFPKKNILFYPKNTIKNKLLDEFKILKDMTFSITDDKFLEVSISERTASYTWCEDDLVVGVPSGEKCYFMDETGFIFAEAPYFSGEVYFKFYGLAHRSTTEGSAVFGTYFSKDNFKQLIYFKDILVSMGLKPVSLQVLDNGDIKFFLSNLNKTSLEPYIILKPDSDFQQIAENLETAINTEPLQSNLKNKYSSLEYIDLRFGNKVYYKFD